jgi:predicted transcriptional regulator
MKALEKIKHGQRVVDSLQNGNVFFVNDIQQATGLDGKSLKQVLTNLQKHGYISKNTKGQWYVSWERSSSN